MAKQEKDSKYNITYEEKVITSEIEYENPMDISAVPVFNLENVEVMYCSLGQKTPKMGHSITLIVDKDFVQKDKQLRSYFVQQRQAVDPNCEVYKSQIKIIGQKDILDGKFKPEMEGKALLNIFTSNAKMFDADVEKGKSLQKMSEATNGNIIYKYFATIDKFSGQAIKPQVYKTVNGEKVTTFMSPKTNKETPLFVGSNDLVNIKLRPYETYSETHGYALKYNLLEIEIVQTAFDRGLSQYKGGKHKVEKAPNAVSFAGLSSMFAGSVETVHFDGETKKASKKEEMPTVESVTGTVGQEPEVKQVQAELPKDTPMQFDFSQLGAELSNANLGV